MAYKENKGDGVTGSYPDNKHDGVVAAGDNITTQDPASIKAGNSSGYKGPGDTSLTVGDPRFA